MEFRYRFANRLFTVQRAAAFAPRERASLEGQGWTFFLSTPERALEDGKRLIVTARDAAARTA